MKFDKDAIYTASSEREIFVKIGSGHSYKFLPYVLFS